VEQGTSEEFVPREREREIGKEREEAGRGEREKNGVYDYVT